MKNVVILGASGHACVIADIVEACGDRVVAFLDDDPTKEVASGTIGRYTEYPDCEFVIGIGNAVTREKLSHLPVRWYTAVHPSAVISPRATVGAGTVIMANAVVNARSVIGEHCIINTGAIVEHDNRIGDFAHISVGVRLGGTVSIGKSSWVGIGATVNNNLNIGQGCLIGAGAVVVKDIDSAGTYVGCPARYMKK